MMFEDNRNICEEAKAAGMEVYQITKNPRYGWSTLDEAVDAFLAFEGIHLGALDKRAEALTKGF